MDSLISKSKLLVVELWGLGDLVIATPFLQAVSEAFDVTLVAKPHAQALAARFFPSVKVVPFVAPWTAFQHKYRLLRWPWSEILGLRALIAKEKFQCGVSARWDPRDHALLGFFGIPRRIGFPRRGSGALLTESLARPGPEAHRYECWRTVGRALNLDLPAKEKVGSTSKPYGDLVIIHTGAGSEVRVWPLDRYRNLVTKLRRQDFKVAVLCDSQQRAWWLSAGEEEVITPQTIEELDAALRTAGAFIGNDSGPGHLAALRGIPTFTLFGSAVPEWFAPLHPAAEWLVRPCPYRPCWNHCHFPEPNCILELDEQWVWSRVQEFLDKHIRH